MDSNNKTYRVRTNVGEDTFLNVNINQDYDILELLSLKISTENIYKLHTSKYGCVVGRVLANGGVGVPNAKISIFIEANEDTKLDSILSFLYPYNDIYTKDSNNIRYNLLPDEEVSLCHQQVGTFPNKRLVLDDDNVVEVFDTYYKYTTTTNNAGDYMIFGVPVGEQNIHMDLDLSDIGILSQKPIDLMYKGYDISQFESTSRFKKDTNLNSLSQIISQNKTVNVLPFWGNEDEGEVKITRHDIDVDYKFETTCIFIGSVVSENNSNAFSKRCIPSVNMGRMDKLSTGSGTIEMIRMRPDGQVESFAIKGNELIDGNGTWCYQIPMNLDYITTDEYGNMVPTDNPEKGIATRTRVRFRVSLSETENPYANNHYTKVLIPHNPKEKTDIDYVFGTKTQDKDDGSGSFRDLMWNNVYTVKSYIPRIQKGNFNTTRKFSGIKATNINGDNNPMPYNNMRVNITFMFVLQCAIIKTVIFFIKVYNWVLGWFWTYNSRKKKACAYIGDGICPDAEGWYFAPGCHLNVQLKNALKVIQGKEIKGEDGKGRLKGRGDDKYSNDKINGDGSESVCVTESTDYLNQCIEINLAMENEVIQFDFYNDWVNGLVYLPRWFVKYRKKRSFLLGIIKIKPKVKACLEDVHTAKRRFVQQCALSYNIENKNGGIEIKMNSANGCKNNNSLKCHKAKGRKYVNIFGKNGGIVHNEETLMGQSVYYPRPCEWINNKKCNLYATDIVLLGNINDCNEQGIPNMLNELSSSTFQMPPNLPQSNMDNDGALFGRGGKSICSGVLTEDAKGGLESVEQTFENYVTWSKNKEFYEKNPDDITEYEVTEMSGIDWTLNPPGYDKYNIDLKTRIFSPGGHFLGIGCVNSQVNTRSCINLSRICEFGSLMSQRQYRVIKDANNNYDYEYIRPTGLISKDEISESSYKYIFSTLNHNGLKTKVTEDGLRKYDFISVNPINFDGAASKFVNKDNSEYNERHNEGYVEEIPAITHTIEDMSDDYYRFRMGLNNLNSSDVISKYLYRNNSNYYIPVYENSYYFYFGLKEGNTALDRFFSDYYGVCFKDGVIENSDIEIKEIKGTSPCDNEGKISIKIIGVTLPCEVEIYNNNTHSSVKKEVYHTSYEYEATGLSKGSYTIAVRNDLHGQGISKTFNIDDVYSNGEEEVITEITVTDFEYDPYIHINSGETYYTYSIQDGRYGHIGYKYNSGTTNNEVICVGTIIYDNDYYRVIGDESSSIENNIIEKVLGKNELKEIKYDNATPELANTIYVWGENTKYNICSIFKCVSNNKYYGYFNEDIYVGVSNKSSYLWMYDESLSLSSVKGMVGSNVSTTGTTVNEKKITGQVILLDKIEDESKKTSNYWKLKKCLIFNNSLFDGSTHDLRLGISKNSEDFNYIYAAEGEKENDNKYYIGDYYIDENKSEEKGFTLDKGSVSVPMYPFLNNTVKGDYVGGNSSLNKDGRGFIFFGTDGNSGNTVALPTYYRPFYFNTVIMMASKDTHVVKNSDDGCVIFAPKMLGEGNSRLTGATTDCNILLFSNVYNGVSIYNKGKYEIGDIDITISNGEEEIAINLTGNTREKEETYINPITTGNISAITTAVVTHIGVITGGTINGVSTMGLRVVSGVTGGTGGNYDINTKEFKLTGSTISSYFGVKEGSIISEEDKVDEIAEAFNGIKFFDNIYVDNGKYRTTGVTGKGVRYYHITRTDLMELFNKLNGKGEYTNGYTDQINWRSVLSYVNRNHYQFYKNEVTDRLVDTLYYNYSSTDTDDAVNEGLNVDAKIGSNQNHIIAVYDVYTNLTGSKGTNGTDYNDEMIDAWSIVPKHTNLFSIVRLYKVYTTNETNYVTEDKFFYQNPINQNGNTKTTIETENTETKTE